MRRHLPSDRAYIYVIGAPGFPQKIGISHSPISRAKSLTANSPHELAVSFVAPLTRGEAYGAERLIHYRNAHKRTRSEWFELSPQEAALAVEAGIAAYRSGERAPKSEGVGTETIAMLMPVTMCLAIDEWRRKQGPRMPSRSEAIRTLVDRAIDAAKPQ